MDNGPRKLSTRCPRDSEAIFPEDRASGRRDDRQLEPKTEPAVAVDFSAEAAAVTLRNPAAREKLIPLLGAEKGFRNDPRRSGAEFDQQRMSGVAGRNVDEAGLIDRAAEKLQNASQEVAKMFLIDPRGREIRVKFAADVQAFAGPGFREHILGDFFKVHANRMGRRDLQQMQYVGENPVGAIHHLLETVNLRTDIAAALSDGQMKIEGDGFQRAQGLPEFVRQMPDDVCNVEVRIGSFRHWEQA